MASAASCVVPRCPTIAVSTSTYSGSAASAPRAGSASAKIRRAWGAPPAASPGGPRGPRCRGARTAARPPAPGGRAVRARRPGGGGGGGAPPLTVASRAVKLRLYPHHDGARIAYREAGTGPPLALL